MNNELSNSLPAIRRNASLMVHSPRAGQKAIDVRRALAELPETTSTLTPIERNVFNASVKRQIREYTDDAELVHNANALFRYIAIDVGYNIPTNKVDWTYIQTRLLDVLKKYFCTFSLNDIKLAFELASVGELDAYLPKDKNGKADKGHYQNFNAEYFSKILHAYADRQGEVLQKVFENTPKAGITDEADKLANNTFAKALIDTYVYYKYHDKMPDISQVQEVCFYKLLFNCGLINEELTQQDLHLSMMEIRRQIAIGLIKPFQAGNIRAQGEAHELVKTGACKFAQSRAIRTCFDWMSKNEIQITDYIVLRNEL